MNNTITALYAALEGSLESVQGVATEDILASYIAGQDLRWNNDGTVTEPEFALMWYPANERRELTKFLPGHDFATLRARIVGKTNAIDVTEDLPLLAALSLRSKLDVLDPAVALRDYGNLNLPIWKLISSDPLAHALAEKMIAGWEKTVADKRLAEARAFALIPRWAAVNGLGAHLQGDQGLFLTEEVVNGLTEAQQGDLLVLLVSAAVTRIHLPANLPDSSLLSTSALNGYRNLVCLRYLQANLPITRGTDFRNWEESRLVLTQMRKDPVGWILAGKGRQERRDRALTVPIRFLQEAVDFHPENEEAASLAELLSQLDNLNPVQVGKRIDALPAWAKVALFRSSTEERQAALTDATYASRAARS